MSNEKNKVKSENKALIVTLHGDEDSSASNVHEVTYALKEDEDPYKIMVKKWREAALRLFVLVSFVALGLTIYLVALTMDQKRNLDEELILKEANFHHHLDHRAGLGSNYPESLCICGVTRKSAGMSQHASMKFPLTASDLANGADATLVCQHKCAAHRSEMIEQLKKQVKQAQNAFGLKRSELPFEEPTRTIGDKDHGRMTHPLPKSSEPDFHGMMAQPTPIHASHPNSHSLLANCPAPKKKSMLGSKKRLGNSLFNAREHEFPMTAPPLPQSAPLLLLLPDPLEEKMNQLEKALIQAAEDSFKEHPATAPSQQNTHPMR